MTQLADAVTSLESAVRSQSHPSLVAVLLTGASEADAGISSNTSSTFCSGFDLTNIDPMALPEQGRSMATLMHDTLNRLTALPLVSIAAVDGYAFGGGAELMTACDMRVMSPSASVRFVQVNMGIVTGWQGATRLTRLLGPSKALELLAGAPTLSGTECHRIGLANLLTTSNDASALDRATKLVDSWIQGGASAAAIRGMKRVVSVASSGDMTLDQSLQFERSVFGELWGGADNMAALKRRGKL